MAGPFPTAADRPSLPVLARIWHCLIRCPRSALARGFMEDAPAPSASRAERLVRRADGQFAIDDHEQS